ncbi:MAG: hypothetical protein ABI183_02690 [Polyangiaceae bacterium]
MKTSTEARKIAETKDELITRLLAKADLAFKCCGFAPPGSVNQK